MRKKLSISNKEIKSYIIYNEFLSNNINTKLKISENLNESIIILSTNDKKISLKILYLVHYNIKINIQMRIL